jgi:hypothetical protein
MEQQDDVKIVPTVVAVDSAGFAVIYSNVHKRYSPQICWYAIVSIQRETIYPKVSGSYDFHFSLKEKQGFTKFRVIDCGSWDSSTEEGGKQHGPCGDFVMELFDTRNIDSYWLKVEEVKHETTG